MLGIIFIYFIGKYFYNLAGDYDKSVWGYAVLGVISYYASAFIAAFLFVIFYSIFATGSIDDLNETVIDVLAIPFGILGCWGLYKLLERNWSKEEKFDENIIDEIGR